jgi:hypothetical protein
MGSIIFQMPSSDVLELSDMLFIPGLNKDLFSISYMAKLQCRVTFEGH